VITIFLIIDLYCETALEYANKAKIFFLNKQYGKSIQTFNESLKKGYKEPWIYEILAHCYYNLGNEAFAANDFEKTLEYYNTFYTLLKKHKIIKHNFLANQYDVPLIDVVKQYKALINKSPKVTFKFFVLFAKNTVVDFLDKNLVKRNIVNVLKPDQNELNSCNIALKILARYIKVLSKGEMELEFINSNIILEIIKLKINFDKINRKLKSQLVTWDSLKDEQKKLLIKEYKNYDGFIIYWNSKNIPEAPASIDLPMFTHENGKKILRPLINIPWNRSRFTEIYLHELFHAFEYKLNIKPQHGFLKTLRHYFPAWRGEWQYDYYHWHFEKTFIPAGLNKILYRLTD